MVLAGVESQAQNMAHGLLLSAAHSRKRGKVGRGNTSTREEHLLVELVDGVDELQLHRGASIRAERQDEVCFTEERHTFAQNAICKRFEVFARVHIGEADELAGLSPEEREPPGSDADEAASPSLQVDGAHVCHVRRVRRVMGHIGMLHTCMASVQEARSVCLTWPAPRLSE